MLLDRARLRPDLQGIGGVPTSPRASWWCLPALTLVGFYAMGVPAILSLALAIGVMFLLAVTVERVVLRPLVNQPDIILFMATFGITYFLIGFGELIFGGEPKQMITSELLLPEGRTSFDVAGRLCHCPAYRYRGCGDRGDHDRHPRRVLFQDPDRTWICGPWPTATRPRSRSGISLNQIWVDRVVCRRHRGPGDRDHVGCGARTSPSPCRSSPSRRCRC